MVKNDVISFRSRSKKSSLYAGIFLQLASSLFFCTLFIMLLYYSVNINTTRKLRGTKMKRLIFIIAISQMLTGCLSIMGQRLETKNDVMQSWVGKAEERLISKWGPPSRSYALPSGGKIISYNDDWGSCVEKFMLEQGKITKWGYSNCSMHLNRPDKIDKNIPIPQPSL